MTGHGRVQEETGPPLASMVCDRTLSPLQARLPVSLMMNIIITIYYNDNHHHCQGMTALFAGNLSILGCATAHVEEISSLEFHALRVEWPRFPFEEDRSDGFLLESEVLQQVGGQVIESLNQSRARSCPVLHTKRLRAGFDLVKQA